jgi:hypothetical protein
MLTELAVVRVEVAIDHAYPKSIVATVPVDTSNVLAPSETDERVPFAPARTMIMSPTATFAAYVTETEPLAFVAF